MKLRKGTTTRGIMNIIKNRRKNDIKRVTDMTVNSLNILIITFIKSVKKGTKINCVTHYFFSKKLVGRGTASAKGRDHLSRRA